MADSDNLKPTQLTRVTSLNDSDLFIVSIDVGTAPKTRAIEKSNAIVSSGGSGGGFNQGFMTNGKIVPSVASNNLTLALKTLAGTDPSASDKVQIRIGDVIHEITAALSVTKNAGTNWFSSGSAELATREVDYFAYIGYNATDGITIGFSRIPYAGIYSEFSTTTTNEKYCAISTITNAASGDNYVNVGRFAATLSAGAGYTWTVPTYTSKNLVQYPSYKTRWLDWVPTRTGYSSIPTNIVYQYMINGDTLYFTGHDGTAGTSNSTAQTLTLPFSALDVTNQVYQFVASANDNSAALATPSYGVTLVTFGWNVISMGKDFSSGAAAWTGSGTKMLRTITGFYRIG